ncbi:MAG: BatD family protein [Polyangiaceae bacterium]|nr:BatD family protein [Polyangiaceae bacterium]
MSVSRRTCALAAVAALTASPSRAPAQSVPDVSLQADAHDVEVGEPVTVTLTVMIDGGSVGSPRLSAPATASVDGPSVTTRSQMSIVNGRVTRREGFSATWQVTPSRPGALEIGPVSFRWDGKQKQAGSVRVTAHPAGNGPRLRGKRRQSNPFGFPFSTPDLDERPAPEPPPIDPSLSLDAPLEPTAFLRTVLDKPRAVVGEQVTASVYLYAQPRVFQPLDPHEPTAPDFFQRPIPGGEGEAHQLVLGGARWTVQLIRRVALFPLHAGDLVIGPMSVTLVGPGFRGGGIRGGLVRASKPTVVHVEEPPIAGRPPGYALGDVGDYTLTAKVEPRAVPVGGSVAVQVILRGNGNVPTRVRLPEVQGVAFTEAEARESIDAAAGIVSGSRSFSYVAQIDARGTVDLGAVTLPFYDPRARAYRTATAKLGVVQAHGDPPAAAPASSGDPLAALAPRGAPAPAPALAAPLGDRPWFWALLLGLPSLALIGDLGARGWVTLRRRRRERARSPAADARAALARVKAATDDRSRDRACIDALLSATEAACGVALRGLTAAESEPALTAAGLPEPLAAEVRDALAALEARAYSGGDPDHEAHARATKLVLVLLKRARG